MYAAAKGFFLNDRLMKKTFCVLAAVVMLASCRQGNVVEEPANLIEEEQMVNMLYDLSLLQASYSVINLEDKRIDGQKFLKDKYGVDSTAFAQSHKYYAAQPEKYQKLQRQVVERLEAEKNKLKSAETKQLTPAMGKIKAAQ